MKKILIGLNEKSFHVKPLTRESLGYQKSDFIVGMISRGIPEKGWDLAIEIVNSYNSSTETQVKLLCIGDGDYLKKLVKEKGGPQIRLVQLKENFQDCFSYYPLFDLFILPTRFTGESVPNVIIESLYWQIPVLASPVGEIPAMLETGSAASAGICVTTGPGNPMQNFQKELERLVKSPETLAQLKNNCAGAFKKFRLEGLAEQYLHLFES